MLDITAIILTFNEEIHIRRCLDGITDVVKEVYLIDCFSSDRTVDIAKEYKNVRILQNKWENSHAKQFNWALDNAEIKTKWVLKLDADEYLTDQLKEELAVNLPVLNDNITGLVIPLRRVFLGRIIKKGMPKINLLRIFQYGVGRSEVRLMDEHIELKYGSTLLLKNEFADDNLNDLSWWTKKHIGYAIREATDLLDIEFNLTGAGIHDNNILISKQAKAKRNIKHKYVNMPLFWRCFAYFIYRYFIKLGFLEGKEGFLWHFLQGWWYRTLVDAKIFEIKKACGNDRNKIIAYLNSHYDIKI